MYLELLNFLARNKLSRVPIDLELQGFSYSESGPQDYGQGVVRLDARLATSPALSEVKRNGLVRVNCKEKKFVYAVARFGDLKEKDVLCMEYDDRLQLGLEKGKRESFYISPANFLGYLPYLWNHPNLTIRIDFKITIAIAVLSILSGILLTSLTYL